MSASSAQAGFVAPDAAELAPHFPGYEIQGLIATGGMGAVYCAVQKSLDRTVALKILPTEFSKDAAFCAGFEAEAKAMARLNHPNLIGVYDFGEVNGMLYIIMEFVPGKSVYHSAYGRAIDPAETIRLVTGICNGLAHAHENGILHRDIKPSNILLDLNVQPKIGDFGLARPIEWKIQEGDEIFGTPHYTAPEVVNAPHSVDYRADIFSVGVLLHELLTGKLPADDPRPASTIIHCDPRFDAIVKKATQTLPAARYSSASEMAKDLQVIGTALAQKSTRVVAPAGIHRGVNTPRSHGYAKRKKSSSTPIVMVVLALIAAAAAYHFLGGKPPQPKPVEEPVIVVPAKPEPTKPATSDIPEDMGPGTATPPEISKTPVKKPVMDPVEVAPVEDNTDGVKKPVFDGTAAPKYDVNAFLLRARKAMQEKSKRLVSITSAQLNSNFSDFEKEFRKQARKGKMGIDEVDALVETWKTKGNRIPPSTDQGFARDPQLQAIRETSEARQKGIDETLKQNIEQLASIYLGGLEKQIERLEADNDLGAVRLLKEEIAQTKGSSTYFSGLMTGTSGNE